MKLSYPSIPLSETFDGPELDNSWIWGTWSGGSYSPNFDGGAVVVAGPNGAWIRSAASYGPCTIECTAAIGASPWQHIGFGSQDFEGDRYLIFSTWLGNGNLYARSNNNAAEQRTDLGPIPSGYHRYQISWYGQSVRYSIDGDQVASHTLATTPPALLIYLSHNAQVAEPALRIDEISIGRRVSLTIPIELVPIVAGALARYEARYIWDTDADWEQGRRAFIKLQEELVNQ